MNGKILKNKPLVEAIFEFKWNLKTSSEGGNIAPHYKVLVGQLYDKLVSEYPEHEELPTAKMPDEMLGHVVQHRFRKVKDGWPLVQIGPGILTVNDTTAYTWADFSERCRKTLRLLFDIYPKDTDNPLQTKELLLRYIDSYEFDYARKNVLEFLKAKTKTNISIPDSFFKDKNMGNSPLSVDSRLLYPLTNPKGVFMLRLVTGKKLGKNAVIWETIVQSVSPNIPQIPDKFSEWLESAHNVVHSKFFSLIEGDLEKEFS